MRRFLIFILIFLLFTANKLLCQQRNNLVTRYQYLDSIIIENSGNHPEKCVISVNEQLDIAKKLNNDSLVYISQLHRVAILNRLGIFDQTLEVLYELLSKLQNNPKDNRISKVLFYIASSYFQMSDYKKSLTYFERSKNAALQTNQYNDTVNINLEMGLVLVALGKKTEGFNLLKTNIETAKMLCNEDAITTGLDNLSNSYFEVGDYENSLRYQLVLSEYPDIIYSSTEYKAGFNQHLAEIFIQLKRWDEAQKHTTLALRYASDMGSNDWLFDCYKNQSAIYEAKGKFKEALDYHKKYLSTKDAVYKSDYDTKMSAMANLYELEHQQNQITQLTTEKQTASVKAERLTYVTGFLILILSLVFTFYQYRKKNAEKDLQQKIAFQLLQAQEEERQRISGELHDSIGQNLLFLKNQLRNDLSPETKAHVMKSVDDALEEIRNISKNLYPNQLEKFGLVAAVEALAAEVRSNSGIFISSDMEGIDDVLNKNVKINFYRIIQEFVNNTLKHAEATAIRITAREINDTIELIVQDNGKGFDMADVERKANSSFGLLNMEERIKMLKGKINIESSIGKGTKSVFIVPV